MGWLFSGGQKTNSVQTPAVTGLQVQTSAYGKCVPFGFGKNRVAPELIWYGAFKSHAQTTGGGGKGGGSAPGSTTYTYTTSLQMAVGEGPIIGIGKVWIGKKIGANVNYPNVPSPGFTVFTGTYSQTAWSYLSTLVTPQFGLVSKYRGGSYSSLRTYKIVLTFTSAVGETLPTSEVSFGIVNSNSPPRHSLLEIGPPVSPPAGATGWNVYVSLTAGTEKKQNAAPLALTASYKEPTSGLVNLGSPPVTDTSKIAQTINYRGIAYLAAANYKLGQNPNLDNHNFEVKWSDDFNGDADPSVVVNQILTNTKYGTIFPSANVGSMTAYQDYCYATGLFISPLYTDQKAAAEMIADIAVNTNSEVVWSSGLLKLIPYGDQSVTANGHTYTPPVALYDLDDDDFIIESSGDDPVHCKRMDPTQFYNSIRLEYTNRDNEYASDIVEAKDQAGIDTYGLYEDGSRDGKIFCIASAARTSVQLQLQRQAVRNFYTFTLDQRYIGLDPMDIVSITDAKLGLNQQWVRILEITENEDWTLTIYAEEVLDGSGSPGLYDYLEGDGFSPDYNIDPGPTNALIIFEAPTQITTNGGLETWIAVSGGQYWGGCDFYISTDNVNYVIAPPRQNGPSRMGTLVDDITSSDTTMTVNLGMSLGELTSGTAADANAGVTLCYLGGEFISFQTATLIAPYVYTLTGCKRGFYGSDKVAHIADEPFARLDSQVFKYPHAKLQIGQSLSIKPLSFNIYGGGQEVLS